MLSISAGHRGTPSVTLSPCCMSQGLTSGSSTTTCFTLLSMTSSSSSSSQHRLPCSTQIKGALYRGAGVGNGVSPAEGLLAPGCNAALAINPLHFCLPTATPGAALPWEPAGQEALRTLVPKHGDLSAGPERGAGAKANP